MWRRSSDIYLQKKGFLVKNSSEKTPEGCDQNQSNMIGSNLPKDAILREREYSEK